MQACKALGQQRGLSSSSAPALPACPQLHLSTRQGASAPSAVHPACLSAMYNASTSISREHDLATQEPSFSHLAMLGWHVHSR